MIRYSAKRLARSMLTLFIIITVVFSLLRLMPVEGYFQNYEKMNDAQIQNGLRQLGLLDPLPVQLMNFYKQVLHGNLGVSNIYRMNVPITQIVAEKAPVSMMMGGMALCISLLLGLPMGAAMARGKGKWFDKIGTGFVVLVQAVPSAVYYLVIQLYGTQIPGLPLPMLFRMDNPLSWILPTFSLAIGNIAYYAMWLRRFMVDESNKDYVMLARAKGVSSKKIMSGHVFRNAFVPLVQYLPTSFLITLMGSIYVESLYSVPGMGGLLVDVIQRQDNTVVQALVLIYAAISILGLLIGDILMAVVDPRISLNKKEGAR